MPENDRNKSNLGESYQPDAAKTYAPTVIRQQARDSYTPTVAPPGNYQPVITVTVSSPTPPTTGSGVPPARPETGPNPPAKSPSE